MSIDASNVPIDITIWSQDLYSIINENNFYSLTNMATSFYKNQIRLCTTMATEITRIDFKEQLQWAGTPLSATTNVCCPDLVSVKKREYVSCRNIDWRKKIVIVNNSQIAYCSSCKRKMLVSKCVATFDFEVIIDLNGQQIKLTAFPDVLEFFDEPTEECALQSQPFHVVYDKKKIMTRFESHRDDLA